MPVAAALTTFLSSPALADGTASPVPQGVMEKPRPDYDAQGIALGDWLLLPSLSESLNYDNNIFRSLLPDRAPAEWFIETTPVARLQRKTETSEIGIFGDIDTFNYARFHRLNLTDWTAGADGSVNFGKPALKASVTGYYGVYHENFDSAEVTRALEQRNQTRYYRGHVEAEIKYEPGLWRLSAGGAFDSYDWQPLSLLNRSGDMRTVSNRDRDESIADPYLRAGYWISDRVQIFGRATYDSRDFTHPSPLGIDRSSSGYRLDGGLDLLLFGQSLKGEMFAGYMQQNFAKDAFPPLPDFKALDYGASLDWYVSPVMTVHFTALRGLSDIILPGVSVSDDQTAKLAFDCELRPDLILQGYGAYTGSHFVGLSRTDRYPSAGVSLRYLMNRYASVALQYTYSSRGSDVAGVNFRDQIVTLGVNLHI